MITPEERKMFETWGIDGVRDVIAKGFPPGISPAGQEWLREQRQNAETIRSKNREFDLKFANATLRAAQIAALISAASLILTFVLWLFPRH